MASRANGMCVSFGMAMYPLTTADDGQSEWTPHVVDVPYYWEAHLLGSTMEPDPYLR